MTRPYIIIRRFAYEEPHHLNLVIWASNGVFTGSLEYYCNADDLARIGVRLMAFPERSGDVFTYELGSCRPEDRFAFHFLLRASTLDSAGHCALQLTMNNNQPQPNDGACSFSISTEAAAINRLGRLFKGFAELKHTDLRWLETEGELLTPTPNAEQNACSEPRGSASVPGWTSFSRGR